jgi:hypothetical protein
MSVFISYSHKDEVFVNKLATRLIEKNIKVWKDSWKTLAGDSFISKINEGIEKASYFCIVLSNNSLKSEWVEKELKLAVEAESKQRQFVILPILKDECKIPALIANKIYADFSKDFNNGLKQILAVVENKYNTGIAGRIMGASTYYIDFALDERQIDGRFFLQIDIVSFDSEETFSILTQFVFHGNEFATKEYLEIDEGESLREYLLITCANKFETDPARIKVNCHEVYQTRFPIDDESKKAHFDVDVRVRWLGTSTRETVLFNIGALFNQICNNYGLKYNCF